MLHQHDFGNLPGITETLWYVATLNREWVALLILSAVALKCAVRDQWLSRLPWVDQAFVIERESIDKKTGKVSKEIAYGIISCTAEHASTDQSLNTKRNHWCIENNCHYIIDWNFDEDRSRIRTGYWPENISRLRRFAVGLIKSKGVPSVAQKMRQLAMIVRSVLD